MNRHDLDFKNIFEILNITSLEIEALKVALIDELRKVQSSIITGKYEEMRRIQFTLMQLKSDLSEKKKQLEKARNEGKLEAEIKELEDSVDQLQSKYTQENNNAESNLPEIRNNANSQRDQIDETIKQVRKSNDFYDILKSLIVVKISYLKNKYKSELEKDDSQKDDISGKIAELDLIGDMLKTRDDIEQYLTTTYLILQNVDYGNHDMTVYDYEKQKTTLRPRSQKQSFTAPKTVSDRIRRAHDKIPPYVYAVKINDKPKKYFIDQDKHIYAYDLGRFQYGSLLTLEGKPTFTSLPFDIIGVIRPDETGEYKSYHAVVYSVNTDPEFKEKIMLSPMLLRNADKNFGFLGTIENSNSQSDSGFKNRIIFDGLDDQDLVTVLSYAQSHEGQIITKNGVRQLTLKKVFEKFHAAMDLAIDKGFYARMDSTSEIDKKDGWTQGDD